jgi:DNA-binding NarL/FixJ family response regulator
MANKKIKVLLADDTLIAREGWLRILETADDIEVVGEAVTAQETPRKVAELNPAVLLMDLKWFGDRTAGTTAIREVRKCCPQVKIIAMTVYEELIDDARRAGADAALTKTFTRDGLLGLIRELASRIESFGASLSDFSLLEKLSNREREVLVLLAKGKKDKEIAEVLSIATTTAKNHVKRILEKLQVRNRTEASNMARELGLSK